MKHVYRAAFGLDLVQVVAISEIPPTHIPEISSMGDQSLRFASAIARTPRDEAKTSLMLSACSLLLLSLIISATIYLIALFVHISFIWL